MSGSLPFGYRWSGPAGWRKAELVPEDAEIVVSAFKTYAYVSKTLVRTLVALKHLDGVDWSKQRLAYVLRNRTYLGTRTRARVVDRATWARVQAMLTKKRRR